MSADVAGDEDLLGGRPGGDKFVNLICFECFQRFHQAARRGIRLDTDFQASVV